MLDEWFSTIALPRKNRAPHGTAYPRSREACGTNTSGIPSWLLPPTRGSRSRLAPVPEITCWLRRVSPPPVSCRAVLLPSRRPGDSGVPRSPSGSPPRVAATRAARCRALPGDRVSSPRGADHAVSGSPDPATGLASDVFPMTDSRQPARGSRTGGASGSLAFASTVMALGSPWPSRSLHRVDSSAFSGSRVPRPRVLLSRARRSRLAPVSSTSSSCRPDGWIAPVDCSGPTSPDAHRGRPRRSPFWLVVRCLVRVSKDRPSTVLGAEESTSREHVAVIASETGRQPASCAAFVVRTTVAVCSSPTRPGCCTGLPVMGFVMFHRRDSEFPPRIPTLRSFALCVQRTRVGSLLHAVGLRHPSRSPWSVHREPCPLVLG